MEWVYDRLVNEIKICCEEYGEKQGKVEDRLEAIKIKQELKQLCEEGMKRIRIEQPGLLIVLMDAYEVTGDEIMLQHILGIVSRDMHRLEISAEGVKLLAYCYHYVEEEECAGKARQMLDELGQKATKKELEMAEQIYRELIEEHI